MSEYLVYKHGAARASASDIKLSLSPVSMAIRFIIHKHSPDNADTYATVWVSPDGQKVKANDVDASWLRSSIETSEELGYTESNFLEILVLTGLSKEDIKGLLQ